jgi:hypothetical protein
VSHDNLTTNPPRSRSRLHYSYFYCLTKIGVASAGCLCLTSERYGVCFTFLNERGKFIFNDFSILQNEARASMTFTFKCVGGCLTQFSGNLGKRMNERLKLIHEWSSSSSSVFAKEGAKLYLL